ncbi:protein rolling stone [Drosophila simulans]|uniref:Uncharacterized protein, isoform A n=2 Tax=Drosophila simulans TaxID=7240 RepID=A0A0J9R2H9_DROSI|nr:protein rolling stone [Drosophila simulans]XP_039152535.1 protein rolling stone [Drosophila simulans]KMY90301.1 uncharacterized protein Dsimw501_GD21983, isoform A [Drosophila simulans]
MFRLLAGTEPELSSGNLQEPLSLRDELRFRRLGLHHHSPTDFLRSQWQSGPKSSIFLAYRWALGGFFGAGVVGCISEYYNNGNFFIFLTNWGFVLCGVTSIAGAILVTFYHYKPETWVPPSCLIKVYWACYWTNITLACVIAFAYWTAIYPKDRVLTNPTRVSDLYNIWTHLLPPIFFTIDNFLVAQPARLLHFVYPLAFLHTYGIFAILFYALGGRNLDGKHYIYPFLNFARPKIVLKTVTYLSIVLVSLSSLEYGVYRLRNFIARKLGYL